MPNANKQAGSRPDAIDLIGASFDHPRDEPAAKALIICAAPRSAVVVHLFRADAVRQFVSLHRALETGRYDFSDRPTRQRADTERLLDKEYLIKMAGELALEDAGFRRFFILSGIYPIFIESEEFFQKTRSIVEKIGEALGISINYERLDEAIALSKPYEYGRESESNFC